MHTNLAYKVEEGIAIYFNGYLAIRATIDVTATNEAAYIERSPILIFPPSHDFYACERQTSAIGGDVILPQTVTQLFPTPGGRPEKITLIARSNQIEIDVRPADPWVPSTLTRLANFKRGTNGAPLVAEGGEVPHPFSDVFNDTATGYSSSFNFEEAFRDAVAKLPPPKSIDELTSVVVTGIGAEFGGIAGIQQMWVSVSRLTIGARPGVKTEAMAGKQ